MKDNNRDGRDDTPITTDAGAYPLFRRIAKEIIQRLLPINTVEATELRQQLVELSTTMGSWTPEDPPPVDERHRIVNRMIATILAAQEFLKREKY